MEALLKLKAAEIDNNFIDSIKRMFPDKEIVIRIYSEQDETTYLTQYPENEKHILENIAAEPAQKFSGQEFDEYVKKNSKLIS